MKIHFNYVTHLMNTHEIQYLYTFGWIKKVRTKITYYCYFVIVLYLCVHDMKFTAIFRRNKKLKISEIIHMQYNTKQTKTEIRLDFDKNLLTKDVVESVCTFIVFYNVGEFKGFVFYLVYSVCIYIYIYNIVNLHAVSSYNK